jgi:hypothetical protein
LQDENETDDTAAHPAAGLYPRRKGKRENTVYKIRADTGRNTSVEKGKSMQSVPSTDLLYHAPLYTAQKIRVKLMSRTQNPFVIN